MLRDRHTPGTLINIALEHLPRQPLLGKPKPVRVFKYAHHKELHAGLAVSVQLHFLLFQLLCHQLSGAPAAAAAAAATTPASTTASSTTTDGGHSGGRCGDVYVLLLILVVCDFDVQVLRVLLPLHHAVGAPLCGGGVGQPRLKGE